jgi:protein SCO1
MRRSFPRAQHGSFGSIPSFFRLSCSRSRLLVGRGGGGAAPASPVATANRFFVQRSPMRLAENANSNKELDIARKPVDIQVAESKDSQIFTMQEFIEKHEMEERASKTISQKFSEVRDNPSWMLWALGFVGLGVMTVVVSIRIRREQIRFDPRLRTVKSFDQEGGPAIGGPFSLVDTTGKRWTSDDFKGKWMYIYFGFTNCPDICPEEMAKMSRLIQHLDKKVGKEYWQPIFISLDPKRDTQEKVKEYLQDFSPRILGLTGTLAEVEQAARQYRVYFAVPDEQVMSENDYLVDHSIIMYLMDPEGKFSDYTTKEFQWFESYSKLLRRMMDYERSRAQDGSADANLKVANAAAVHGDGGSTKMELQKAIQNAPQTVGSFRR